jgi:hypothetical protein
MLACKNRRYSENAIHDQDMFSQGIEPDSLVPKEVVMSFVIYLVGFAIFIGGVAWALVAMGVPYHYVAIVSVILLGIGVLSGVSRTRSKDPS